MKKENKEYLLRTYPTLFQEYEKKPAESPFAVYDFEIDDGWFELVKGLCESIMKLEPGPNFRVLQVKEKFGGLRFYCGGWPHKDGNYLCQDSEAIGKLIGAAENDSMETCERCGSKEGVTLSGGWVKAYCPVHRAERDAAEAERIARYKAEREKEYAEKARAGGQE